MKTVMDMPAQDRLAALDAAIKKCTICRDNPLSSPLPHEPRPVAWPSSTAKICIAGQAPGLRVHESGIPFDDRSGDRLREWLGMTRDEFYDRSKLAIIPMGFCFPGYDAKGGDLPPRKECAPKWRADLFAAMPQVELVLVIGQYAQAWHLGKLKRKTLTETVQNWRDIVDHGSDPIYLPMPHPSWRNTGWLKRNPWFEEELLPYLRAQVERLC